MKNSKDLHGYAGNMVKTHDPDRFLISMFFDADVRADLWTLYAFHHEISRTREVVTDTHIGLIRLQWWRDCVAEIYTTGTVPAHPIANELADVIQRRGLNREWFNALLYAREFDLEDVLPGNLSGLVNYVDFTQTPLMRLALQITEPAAGTFPVQKGDDSVDAASVAPVSIAWGLAGVLRAIPFHASQARCYMPADLMNRAGLSTDALYAARGLEKLPAIVAAIRAEGETLLRNSKDNGREPRLVRLYRSMAAYDLKRIARAKNDVFSTILHARGASFPVRLWFAGR